MNEEEKQYVRDYWDAVLDAFGAWIEVQPLPEPWASEYREIHDAGLVPARVVLFNQDLVTGPVLVELDAARDDIVEAYTT